MPLGAGAVHPGLVGYMCGACRLVMVGFNFDLEFMCSACCFVMLGFNFDLEYNCPAGFNVYLCFFYNCSAVATHILRTPVVLFEYNELYIIKI